MKKVIFDSEYKVGKILVKAYMEDNKVEEGKGRDIWFTMESKEDEELNNVCDKLMKTSLYREVVTIDGKEKVVIPEHELLTILL